MAKEIVLKLLDWPFLAFVLVLACLALFRRQLGEALRRGDVLISWGENRSLKLSQLSSGLDAELGPLRDDLEAVKAAVRTLEHDISGQVAPVEPPAKHADLDDVGRQAAHVRMVQALAGSEYTWRSIERLAALAGITEAQATSLLRGDPEVVLGTGKSGRQIARLAARRP